MKTVTDENDPRAEMLAAAMSLLKRASFLVDAWDRDWHDQTSELWFSYQEWLKENDE